MDPKTVFVLTFLVCTLVPFLHWAARQLWSPGVRMERLLLRVQAEEDRRVYAQMARWRRETLHRIEMDEAVDRLVARGIR